MSKLTGYQKRTHQKYQAIFDVAEKLFINNGLDGVTISQIAKAAKVSQVTIYNYFGSKKDLFYKVMHNYLSKLIKKSEEIIDSELPFKEKFKLIIDIKYNDPLSKSMIETNNWNDPAIRKMLIELTNKYTLPLSNKLFELGKEEGVLDKNIPNEAVSTYLSAIMPLITDEKFFKASKEYKQGIRQLTLYGLFDRNDS